MLNAKEKALDLYEKMWDVYQHDPVAKECALICVDELIEVYDALGYDEEDTEMVYLEEVKNQINLL